MGLVHAQTPFVEYLGIENGLSNNSVTSIYQDHNGFMWFGTYDGLNRYDGYEFKVFRNVIGDSTSLHFNHVTTIEGDADHNIWLGGQKGVSIYNPLTANFSAAKYHPYKGSKLQTLDKDVGIVKAVTGGALLVGTHHFGLIVFQNSSLPGIQIPLHFPQQDEKDYGVTAIEYDSLRQIIYVFVNKAGLFSYDVKQRKLTPLNTTLKQASSLKVGSSGSLWVGGNKTVHEYSAVLNSYKNPLSLKSSVINLCYDKKGVLWIATDGAGVWLLQPGHQTPTPLLTPAGKGEVNSNAVYAVYEDVESRKWIGTLRGGISLIEPRASVFQKVTYTSPAKSSIADNFIMSFCEAGKNVWVGTDGAGLRYWNRATNKFSEFVHDAFDDGSISSNFITNIIHDSQKDLWVSTWFGGINRLKKGARSFEHFTCYNPVSKSAENNVWFLYEDSQKRLWASATNDGSLYLFNRSLNQFEIFDDKVVNCQSITEDRNGTLWAGNYSELVKLDTKNKKHTVYSIGYSVRCILEDKAHNFWVGTQEGGLLLFDRKTGKYQRFTTKDGIPNNTVLRLLEDKNGNLWMSTFKGLSKFDTKTKLFRNYFQSDGLQSNQFSFNAALALTSGEFLFGGIKGFDVFYPDSVYSLDKKPRIFLSGLKINNAPVEQNPAYVSGRSFEQINEITLPYDRAVLSLDFLALEYSGSDKIQYAYYLENWDKSWNYTNNIRTANYSRLREGTYTFQVKVSSADNKWSNEMTLLKIKVLPPWYRTWWAYLLYLSLGLGAIYLYLLYKNRQSKLKYQVKVAQIEAEKDKELNEKKLLFFTNISHEFRTPLSLIINPIKDILDKKEDTGDNEELSTVYRNARRLLRLVDQLLLFKKADSEMGKLNIVNLNLYGLCKEVYSCFLQQARAKKITYTFEFANKALNIYADREKLEIALFNLLSNAFKYTPENGNVVFQVVEEDNTVKILIKDSGVGIPAGTDEKLFERFYQGKDTSAAGGFGIGLYLVKNFIEAHEGKISYQSKEGQGTSFFISLKKNIEAAITPNLTSDIGESSVLLKELNEDGNAPEIADANNQLGELMTDQLSLLIVDDDRETVKYLSGIFKKQYKVYEAWSGEDGIRLAREHLPDLVISDVHMKAVGGIDLCKNLKEDSTVSHIPVILITGSSSDETKLKGIESGADDYIQKPFDKELLIARVSAILRSRNSLQKYFYNEVTLQSNNLKVSVEYKEFLERCMHIVESHLENEDFSIKTLASEIGMSHSNLYKKVKSVSGQSVNGFIRFIRLRKAAEILINTENNVNQTAGMVGFNDIKYFREQFNKLFGMNPSEYIKKFRKTFHNTHDMR
jgi:signal transduction histidine kinase/ligand-binding sensor domain-containing protein/DNA-binding response OmpR family regulator